MTLRYILQRKGVKWRRRYVITKTVEKKKKYKTITKGIYQEAYNHLQKKGWTPEAIKNYAEAGRMMVIGTYYENTRGGLSEGKIVHYGFPDKRNKAGEELNSPPYYGAVNESFEDAVNREYEELGYSETLDISIEDCQTPGAIDIDDIPEVLEYLMTLKR